MRMHQTVMTQKRNECRAPQAPRKGNGTIYVCIMTAVLIFFSFLVIQSRILLQGPSTLSIWDSLRTDKMDFSAIETNEWHKTAPEWPEENSGMPLVSERLAKRNSEGLQFFNNFAISSRSHILGRQYYQQRNHEYDPKHYFPHSDRGHAHYRSQNHGKHTNDGHEKYLQTRHARCRFLCASYRFAAFDVCLDLCQVSVFPFRISFHAELSTTSEIISSEKVPRKIVPVTAQNMR